VVCVIMCGVCGCAVCGVCGCAVCGLCGVCVCGVCCVVCVTHGCSFLVDGGAIKTMVLAMYDAITDWRWFHKLSRVPEGGDVDKLELKTP